jgi:hypothetical protein
LSHLADAANLLTLTAHRGAGAFGANLDSLADMASAGAALGVVIMSYGHFRAAYVPVAVQFAAATAMRLSYFNVHGLDAASGRSSRREIGTVTSCAAPPSRNQLANVAWAAQRSMTRGVPHDA